ncbi:MAG TPA: hypothetical protein VMM92_02155, partial [Thermoanaerobaculia bacterium]|nr:hypothetical protein [Thermoanaerobaculia bacterium]
MRKMLLTLTLAGAALLAPGLTPAAHAGGFGWFAVGAGFRVGGLHLSFVLGQPFAAYAPAYYYRSYEPITYAGYRCTSRCFIDHGVYYHDRACPVVHQYLAAYRVDPYRAYVNYAPRYQRYYDGGYYERHGGYYAYNGYPTGRGGYRYDGRYDGYSRDSRYDGYSRDSRYDGYARDGRNERYDRRDERYDRRDDRRDDRYDRRNGRNDRNERYDHNDRNDRRNDPRDHGHDGDYRQRH